MKTFSFGDVFSGKSYPDMINDALGTNFYSYKRAGVSLDDFGLPGVIAWFVFMDGSEHGYFDDYRWKNFLGGDLILEEAVSEDKRKVMAMQDMAGYHPFRLAFQMYHPKNGEWRCRFVGAYSLLLFLKEDLTKKKYIKIADEFRVGAKGEFGKILNPKKDFYKNMPKYFTPVTQMGFSNHVLLILKNGNVSTAAQLLELGLGASNSVADEIRRKLYEVFKEPEQPAKPCPKPIAPPSPPPPSLSPPPSLGTTVMHKKYGEGTIVKFDGENNHLTVAFAEGEKVFLFPNCFDKGFLEKIS